MEELVSIKSNDHQLEGLLDPHSDSRAVVITHPHSLYGGDMHNSVVYTIHHCFSGAGFTTLRFNFSGVGNSEGRYAEGLGEQEDLLSAHRFLTDKGYETIDLAGYSFGAWVGAALACRTDLFRHVYLISPPVNFMDFSDISEVLSLRQVIVGDRDDFADLSTVRSVLNRLKQDARLDILPDTDHFYSSRLTQLSEAISANLE